jgi:hypothetical protein
MRSILSIARRGIAALKNAFGQPHATTEHLPALRMITYLPEPVRQSRSAGENRGIVENRGVKQLPPVPIPDQRKPGQRKSALDQANDDDLELRRICEAIGLDVKEVTGESAPRVAIPASSHDFGNDHSHEVSNNNLSNDVSADVLKLIEHVEATNPQKPGSRPSIANASEPATSPVRQTRARSSRPASRESAQTPVVRASDLADVLASLKLRLLKIRLAPDDIAEAQAEIATAIAQLLSPRPKPQIIALSLNTLLSILGQAGVAPLPSDIETSVTRIWTFLKQLSE